MECARRLRLALRLRAPPPRVPADAVERNEAAALLLLALAAPLLLLRPRRCERGLEYVGLDRRDMEAFCADTLPRPMLLLRLDRRRRGTDRAWPRSSLAPRDGAECTERLSPLLPRDAERDRLPRDVPRDASVRLRRRDRDRERERALRPLRSPRWRRRAALTTASAPSRRHRACEAAAARLRASFRRLVHRRCEPPTAAAAVVSARKARPGVVRRVDRFPALERWEGERRRRGPTASASGSRSSARREASSRSS